MEYIAGSLRVPVSSTLPISKLTKMAFVQSGVFTQLFKGTRVSKLNLCSLRPSRVAKIPVQMGLGEDGLKEDMDSARAIIENGASTGQVQDMMTNLERRRAVLSLEVTQIEDIIEELAQNVKLEDKSILEKTMEVALGMFAPSEDKYPGLQNPTGYTMDKYKK